MKRWLKNLNEAIANRLQKLDFVRMRDDITVAQGLFVKRVGDDLFLSLGVTISRYEEGYFSASYYLSPNTTWGAVWDDIPIESYSRVAHFLSSAERLFLLESDYEQGRDGWWNGSDEKEIEKFVEVIRLTESRMLENQDLIEKIKNSSESRKIYKLSQRVAEKVAKLNLKSTLKAQNLKELENYWYPAAKEVLIENHEVENKNTVRRLAGDAWRKSLFKKN